MTFFYGPMGSGKTILAQGYFYNFTSHGMSGLLLTCMDRGGPGVASSRFGVQQEAIEIYPETDIYDLTSQDTEFIICDELQFYTVKQVSQLIWLADHRRVDIYAFGLSTNFTGHLFEASSMMFRYADQLINLSIPVLCWCGKPGSFNARVQDARIMRSGPTIAVGDTIKGAGMEYRVLCRKHFISGDLDATV